MKFTHVFLGLIVTSSFGATAADDFNWLRDDARKDERVLTYLTQQNRKTEQYQKSYQALTQDLLAQWETMVADKGEQPWSIVNGREWTLTRRDGRYVLLSRASQHAPENAVFDFAERQSAHQYYQLGQWHVSGDKLLFTEDIDGSEQYHAVVVDLLSGQSTELATHVDSGVLLSPDGKMAYLVSKEMRTQRPHQILRISTESLAKTVVWHEYKSDWLLSFYRAADSRYVVLQSNNESTTEQKLVDLETGTVSDSLRVPEAGVEYYADVAKGRVYVNSNLEGTFALYQTDLAPLSATWQRFTTPREPLDQFFLYDAGVVALSKPNNVATLTVYSYQGQEKVILPLEQDGNVAWLSTLGDFESNKIRIRSMSMTTPPQWEEFDVKTLTKTLYSQDSYQDFDSQHYVSKRIFIKHDGVSVPVSLAYRKDKLHAQSPVMIYGYGAYGFTMKPYFMPQVISLLDQGVIYAIAHVRGGGYFGDEWHEQGRGVRKANSIGDFVAAAKTMKTFERGNREVFAIGSSAGGTLVAGAVNRDPKLFSGVVLKVPFVDVVASMSDTSLPLTTQQYGEWGNPTKPEQLALMKAYDPILNIQKDAYPPMLVQVGLIDQRVPYWEGAKYLAKVSELSEHTGPYLLQTDFNSGHQMDPRQAQEQQAKEYAFLLSLINTSKAEQ
ncbi:S9 family peptidase [Vibrio parahaemolyticus]|uniref:prolyl oligopeptidase family serine peptidase n=1 Tax=Vibrio parahaemolyticus TaxID=670 RepID=UPI00081376D1|nr:prolyl oligopeptidase family serine peptidase [Vibrio parahaemolyticus]EGQ8312272.1 prolyl oligopeptidase family serine peptidase [Vibrio parahaemolyticus]EGQ8852040.1 prolyl oligopeptidase family serine peptidase [Vibrio parahaemolyticus]EGQ8856665.1 prolyl oligopeptidase family serine peptidase [Vibrio parahaemolyticus]EGQ8876153.1 prolyl oligopeptidase family serine peptidase [Vibrio parahaemolyticus]EGQ8995433.1 prolyl oligopeptidase family serine peptidase [Vibrio parahaemolyticus]